MTPIRFLESLPELAPRLDATGGALSSEAAAHVHRAAATGTRPGEKPKYSGLRLLRVEAVFPPGTPEVGALQRAQGPIAVVLSENLLLHSQPIRLADGTLVRTLSREATIATLLGQGGLAIGIAGSLLMVVPEPRIDADAVREILKAARLGDRYQTLLELLDVTYGGSGDASSD